MSAPEGKHRGTRVVATLGLLLAFVLPARAQNGGSVNGSVVDESGASLRGATVTLAGRGAPRSAVTSGTGKFHFLNVEPGTYSLSASLSRFGTMSREGVVVSNEAVELKALALPVVLRGEEVVVTASKVETELIDSPATISVVSSDAIASSPAQNYGDLLRSVPGLNIIQMSARDVNITSRQATSVLSNSQLALVDGRSIYLDFFGVILWELVPSDPSDIKQIEVVRGPASAVWGANALAGVINIITRSPREAPGGRISLTGGVFSRDAGISKGGGAGQAFGGNLSYAGAPNDVWSFRLAGGYYDSDAFARPAGRVPLTSHPLDTSLLLGGATFPAYENKGTRQPKLDLRLDQELGGGTSHISYSFGYAGTTGITHSGIGPYSMKSGSHLAYGRVAFARSGLKVAGFVNLLDVMAPNLLTRRFDGSAIDLDTRTRTFDVEVGNTNVLAGKHILSYGGNARRNNFDIGIAPDAKDRKEFGAYFQDEIFFHRFRFSLGGRLDKFGSLDDPFFSPRLSAMFKPTPSSSFRASFNRAFRSPSTINNSVHMDIAQPVNLSAVALQVPPAFRAPFISPNGFPLLVQVRGNPDLKEESINAYEVGYTGTFAGRTTLGAAFYINDQDNNINFVTNARLRPYTASNPPPLFPPQPLGGLLIGALARMGVVLPGLATYQNIGKLRQKGLELSVDHSFRGELTGYVNYSYQWDPEPRDPPGDPNRYPTEETSVPAHHRANLGVNANFKKWLASVAITYTSVAYWTDVLSAEYHGPTDAYTMVNASVGIKWLGGRLATTVKCINLTNEDIRQHIFGDIVKRQVMGELRYQF